VSAVVTTLERDAAYFLLKGQIEEFLFDEAALLDERRFTEWLDLLAGDLHYFMPVRRNVRFGEHAASENTRADGDISWFDEDKWTLAKRVEQLMTGIHWAEEPLSRVCRLISNIQLIDATPSVVAATEVHVKSRFIVYQNRVDYETYWFVGKRLDVLRCAGGSGWQLAKREITLEQSVLLAKNLTVLF
jgi:3-phenylpropionate/cinnamic acid dioxygenase small subunit